jgi:hypothetical protein
MMRPSRRRQPTEGELLAAHERFVAGRRKLCEAAGKAALVFIEEHLNSEDPVLLEKAVCLASGRPAMIPAFAPLNARERQIVLEAVRDAWQAYAKEEQKPEAEPPPAPPTPAEEAVDAAVVDAVEAGPRAVLIVEDEAQGIPDDVVKSLADLPVTP